MHAVERARLGAAIECADRHLTALGAERDKLASATANADEVRAERDGIDRRVAQLDREAHVLIDEQVERAVAQPPEWAREVLGERPTHRRDADHWDRAVRVLERFRVEHVVSDDGLGIGPEPADPAARTQWRLADETLRQTQERLGRVSEQEPARDVAFER
jgi:hypothetical protein